MALVKEKVFHTRYWTYYLEFPDGETWVQQEPFIHDLQWELAQSCFDTEPHMKRDLLVKGETKWTDQNGLKHWVRIEDKEQPRRWGLAGQRLVR